MDDLKFNPFQEKLNVAVAIEEIGPGKEMRLVFDDSGNFMVSDSKIDYYPTEQGPLKEWTYETCLTLKKEDCGDFDWPKYTAEDMIAEIEKQIKNKGLRLV